MRLEGIQELGQFADVLCMNSATSYNPERTKELRTKRSDLVELQSASK